MNPGGVGTDGKRLEGASEAGQGVWSRRLEGRVAGEVDLDQASARFPASTQSRSATRGSLPVLMAASRGARAMLKKARLLGEAPVPPWYLWRSLAVFLALVGTSPKMSMPGAMAWTSLLRCHLRAGGMTGRLEARKEDMSSVSQ